MKVETIHASAQETGAGDTGEGQNVPGDKAAVYVDVTARGTTLTVFIESKDPLSGAWAALGDTGALTALGCVRVDLPNLPEQVVRARWTLTGNHTFSVSAVSEGYHG